MEFVSIDFSRIDRLRKIVNVKSLKISRRDRFAISYSYYVYVDFSCVASIVHTERKNGKTFIKRCTSFAAGGRRMFRDREEIVTNGKSHAISATTARRKTILFFQFGVTRKKERWITSISSFDVI